MEHCDVLIVGGGPGGSSCAWRLRQLGCDVVVLDRRVFPRHKVCAGWVTPQVFESLAIDVEEYAAWRVLQPISGFRTGIIGGREIENHYGRTVSYGIRRCEFDEYLLRRSGARLRLGAALESLERDAQGWIVNGDLRARALVGAGGHFCPVARQLGARQLGKASVVAAQESEFLATPEMLAHTTFEPNVPELYFCPDLAGYGWVFRKGEYLNIGLGRIGGEQTSAYVAEFVDFLRARGKIACPLLDRFHGHAYQLYERVAPRLLDDGALLVGDAAGLAYPQSGEGIRPAVESGLLAAETLHAAAGDYARERLAPYRDRVVERLGPPRSASYSDWLPAAWLRVAAAQLLASRRFTRRVVIENWFLHMHRPALCLGDHANGTTTSASETRSPADARLPLPLGEGQG